MSSLVLLAGLIFSLGVWLLSRPRSARRPSGRSAAGRPPRSDTRPAAWYHLATYADGRFAHLTPMRDGDHFEDETGECGCNPSSAAYRTREGRRGVFYVHRLYRTAARHGYRD